MSKGEFAYLGDGCIIAGINNSVANGLSSMVRRVGLTELLTSRAGSKSLPATVACRARMEMSSV